MLADAKLVALELQPIGYNFLTNSNKSIKHPITSVEQSMLAFMAIAHGFHYNSFIFFNNRHILNLVPEYYQLIALV